LPAEDEKEVGAGD